ncbi:MAG: LysR substrate-binding domain-containing protein [Pseudomonas sp.]|uniref:LysR family transcriptional regulator n=1 Tax=Pseudomonas sp. TaxID=306 RepID=UPI00398217FF
MNLHHLKVFLAIAQSGSISAGAARLFISQPAVTREIRELEARLRLPLFDRQSRGVTLTAAGQRLLPYAERIFALEQAAERDLQAFANLGCGELYLGASATLGSYLLPALISDFHQQYPDLQLSLQIDNTAASLQQLEDNATTLAFIEGPFAPEQFSHRHLGTDALLPIASPSHPLAKQAAVSPSELAAASLLIREQGSGTRATLEQAYQALGLRPRIAMALGNSEALKRSLLAGQSVAWISELAVQEELRSGQLCRLPVSDLQINRDLHAVWRREHSLSPAALALLEQVEQALSASKGNIKTF